jgi:hypothetical protein
MSYIGKAKAKLRRQKIFSDGRQTPIDRNDRARVMLLAHQARGDGRITRAAVDVLRALIYQFANLKDGRCFPSYERIAEAARCNARTVGRCLPDLEAAGFLTWVNRVVRVRERVAGLGGMWASSWRVIRTSNSYEFPLIAKREAVKYTKGQNCLGTTNSSLSFLDKDQDNSSNPVSAALASLYLTLHAG